MDFKKREQDLILAHKKISQDILVIEDQLEELLNQRLKIAGSIEEIRYIQKKG